MKKIITVLCIIAMCLNFCVFSITAEDGRPNDVTEKDGLRWVFDEETATLTISGDGDMRNYASLGMTGPDSPANARYDVKHIVVKEGITSIGNGAFEYCGYLESIELPDTITHIGTGAFGFCVSLKEIEIPASVKSMCWLAFGERLLDSPSYIPIEKITFYGNPPKMEYYKDGMFDNFKGTVRYPDNNPAWTKELIEEISSSYGSDITWEPFNAPELTKAEQKFIDVMPETWYLPGVQYVFENDIMSGMGNGCFEPAGKLTREQLMQVFFAMEGKEKSDYTGDTGFADVPGGRWYSSAVKWAKEEGITDGVGEGVFGVGEYVTREQLVTFIMNYTEYKNGDTSAEADLSLFADSAEISDWALNGFEYCVAKDIISGREDGTLDPRTAANRAELAQILKQYASVTV